VECGPGFEELVGSGERMRAATRNPAQVRTRSGIEPVLFDYDNPDTSMPALKASNRIFLIGPPVPSPHRVMLPFLEAATRDKRKLVLMTAMGTEFEDNGSLRQVELALERSGAPFVILRPNWFMDNFHTSWLDPIRPEGVVALPGADARTSLIDVRDIAASAAAVLGMPDIMPPRGNKMGSRDHIMPIERFTTIDAYIETRT
jgi:uncharacterized protein YbjT (DUF2867 family)